MCKLYFSNQCDPETLSSVLDAILATERDGSGIGLIAPDGGSVVHHARPGVAWAPAGLMSKALGLAQLPEHKGLVIAHGRTATGPRTDKNTHPLIEGLTFLAHNGVVSGRPVDATETDSWLLARLFNETASAEEFAKAVKADVQGMAAVMAYHAGRKEVIIARDDTASLYYHERSGIIQVATRESMLPKGAVKFPANTGVVFNLKGEPRESFTWKLQSGRFAGYQTGYQTALGTGSWWNREEATLKGTVKAGKKETKAAKERARRELRAKLVNSALPTAAALSAHDRAVADEVARKFRDAQAALTERGAAPETEVL